MRIKFVGIRIHNFLSIADESISLEDMGFTIVTGINNRKTDNASSNGSGKSSIFNAICYALTGETAQGVSNNIENIFSNPDDCWVEIELYVDSDRFVIRRKLYLLMLIYQVFSMVNFNLKVGLAFKKY